MIKLIASDLDGTVVPHGGAPSARTIAAFRACERAGIGVVFVTGRPPRWMGEVAELTGGHGTAICANGALTLDLADFSVISSHLLPARSALAAAHVLSDAFPDVAYAAETPRGFRECAGYPAPDSWHGYRDAAPARDMAEMLADNSGVVKLLANSYRATSDEMLALARANLGSVVTACHSTPDGDLGGRLGILEMAAPGVTKATTLAEFATARGIEPGEVIAFGDMPNDVDMLRWAGTSFAMADGHPEARAAAGNVAPPAADDGVAQVLELLAAGPERFSDAGAVRVG